MQSNGYRKEEGDFSEINHSKILNPLPDYQSQVLQSSFPLAYGTYDCQPIGLKKFVGNQSSPILLLTEKKMHNLKTENYVLFGGLTEDLSPGDSLSDNAEGLFQKGKGGARIYSLCKKKLR